MSTTSNLIQAALALPEAKRAELACQIILSLDPDWRDQSVDISERSLAAIVKLRAERTASGEFRAYSLDETMTRIREAIMRESSK